MSSYYANILQPGLPNAGSQDPFVNQEGKFDASYYGTMQGVTFDGPGEGHSPATGFPRYPPYDRLHELTSMGSKVPGYPTTTSYQNMSVSSFPPAQNGQYTDGLTMSNTMSSCKLQDRSVGTPTGGTTQPMVSHFSHAGMTAALNSGVQAQNIPIYPWMRPMNGGKLMFIYTTLYTKCCI